MIPLATQGGIIALVARKLAITSNSYSVVVSAQAQTIIFSHVLTEKGGPVA
jgi:hypothetical protein